jgi:hypothetical protein
MAKLGISEDRPGNDQRKKNIYVQSPKKYKIKKQL